MEGDLPIMHANKYEFYVFPLVGLLLRKYTHTYTHSLIYTYTLITTMR